VQTQHHTPVLTLARSEGAVRERLLGRPATTAAVVTGGGRSMLLTNRAQRLAGESRFLMVQMVQAQTQQSRTPHLNALITEPG
jgi:hypothetical protein